MNSNPELTKVDNKINPNVDDSLKPDYKVSYLNKSTKEKGSCTIFTYEYGVEVVMPVFKTLYPERRILKISAVMRD